MKRAKRTKIVATLGPASSSYDIIHALAERGVDVFRLNFSHGDHKTHQANIEHIRRVEKETGHILGVLADLQGPKLRIGTFKQEKMTLLRGETFTLTLDEVMGDQDQVTLPHPEIFKAAEIGSILLINDGLVRLSVKEKQEKKLVCQIVIGGEISNRKGVNVPGIHLPLSAMTQKDKTDLDFILTQDVDWIALSFVQTAEDVLDLKKHIHGKAKVIAKLEKPLALKHLKDIVDASDAVMVARGDLGVELALEDVPVAQKKIIKACRKAGKPVVVATQMLESMIHNASPTRAEVSDVAGAIFDQVDAVMLSAESASGAHPLEAVTIMSKIIHAIEKDLVHDEGELDGIRGHTSVSGAITAAAREITCHLNIPLIITVTDSGATTLAAAKERPHAAILALTQSLKTARQLSLCWGAYAATVDSMAHNIEEMAVNLAKSHHLIQKGDKIVLTAGIPFKEGSTHALKVVDVF